MFSKNLEAGKIALISLFFHMISPSQKHWVDYYSLAIFFQVALTLFIGVALGVSWGSLAKFIPHSQDHYVTELRVLFVLVGGLFANFFTLHFGWGGIG